MLTELARILARHGEGSRRSWGTKESARRLVGLVLAAVLAASLPMLGGSAISHAAGLKVLSIGMSFPVTGAEAEEATGELNGARLAVEEANARHAVPGYELQPIILNDATTTAAGYDPAQAATNARMFVNNPSVVAVVGPTDSGSAKAMLPILAGARLAIVSGSTTSPDLTNPKFAAQFRANGVTIVYFRTCANEDFVEPGMVNFLIATQKIRNIYVLDDGGAGGVGLADAFQSAALKKGIKVLGHDSLDPKEADYTTILTKIKGLRPDYLEWGGISGPGAKLAKQAYDILPSTMLRGDGGGIYGGDFLQAAGFPAAEGWYSNSAAPHIFATAAGRAWESRFVQRWHQEPSDYNFTTFGAGLVVVDAIARVVKSGAPVTRANIRAAIQSTKLQTVQGPIAFDANGDLVHPPVSIYRVTHDPKYSDTDLNQFKYIGAASP
jgi:branched-chain amino acid transport system substrate-binding protein